LSVESLLKGFHIIRMSHQLRLHLASLGFLTVALSLMRNALRATLSA
jgi:hypothetical protein